MKIHIVLLLLVSNFCPSPAFSQTGPSPSLSPDSTTSGDTSNSKKNAESQPGASPAQSGQNPSSTELNPVVVIGQLDQVRDQIVPYLGATKYSIGQQQIQTQSQGANTPFNQVILRAPGVAQDSYGQLHVRDEHANLQFRIDDVLIPEGITGFGQEISTHLVKSVDLITGSLPAQFGFRTSGIIDIHTKEGVDLNGGRRLLLRRLSRDYFSEFPSWRVGRSIQFLRTWQLRPE